MLREVDKARLDLKPSRLWLPKRAVFTAAALSEAHGQRILERIRQYDIPLDLMQGNRLPSFRGEGERETYRIAKSTLAVVTSAESALRLRPIPPSADWQFHLAEGCPAHCQYCYLAGSLKGAPVVRVFADLDRILGNLRNYERSGEIVSFEASCYTDPLSIEHLTGSLTATIEYFGTRPNACLRWVTKFDAVDPLLALEHGGRTRCRFSLNAEQIGRRFEAGAPPIINRLNAVCRVGRAGYPIGVVLAPIIPIEGWQERYSELFDLIAEHLDPGFDLTFELITHRFTPGSKEVLQSWYPNSTLDLDETKRTQKRNKFGSYKYIYPKALMQELKGWFFAQINRRFGSGHILYWT